MDPQSLQLPGDRVDGARDHVGGEDVCRVGIWVSQEVGERYRGKRVVVGKRRFEELDHYELRRKGICRFVVTSLGSREEVVRGEAVME